MCPELPQKEVKCWALGTAPVWDGHRLKGADKTLRYSERRSRCCPFKHPRSPSVPAAFSASLSSYEFIVPEASSSNLSNVAWRVKRQIDGREFHSNP